MSIQVLNKNCIPSDCQNECISVCPQNKKGKIAIRIENENAMIVENKCINCFQCVYSCPFGAIEIVLKDKQKLTKEFLETEEKKVKKEKQVIGKKRARDPPSIRKRKKKKEKKKEELPGQAPEKKQKLENLPPEKK